MHVTPAEYEALPGLLVDRDLALAKVEDEAIAAQQRDAANRAQGGGR